MLTNREQLTILGLAILGGLALQIGWSISVGRPHVVRSQKRGAEDLLLHYPRGAPIPNGSDAPSDKQFCDLYRSWLRRIAVKEYQENPDSNKEVAAFLEDGISYLIGVNVETECAFAARAAALEQTGCKDPVFQLFAGLVTQDPAKKQAFLSDSLAGFEKTSYPRFLAFMAAANLAKSLSDQKANAATIQPIDDAALKYLAEGLNAGAIREEDMPALRWRLCGSSVDSLILRRGSEIVTVVGHSSAVAPWLSNYFAGRRFLKEAWKSRGGGWADSVTADGWRGWSKNLAFARERLTRSWELNPKDPAAAADMIEVAMGDHGGKSEMRHWFDRAVAAQMDFPRAYTNFVWGLRPRWLGSHEEMLEFGRECIATKRYDTTVPYRYVNIVREVASEESDPNAVYRRPEITNPARATLSAYIKTETRPFSVSYIHTLAAIIAYKSGDLPAAKEEMLSVRFRPDPAHDLSEMENLGEMLRKLAAIKA